MAANPRARSRYPLQQLCYLRRTLISLLTVVLKCQSMQAAAATSSVADVVFAMRTALLWRHICCQSRRSTVNEVHLDAL